MQTRNTAGPEIFYCSQ